ncbi:hypothetical protein [Aquimarina sp. AU58]|uniref:hypothetical protein n=1 Tax=Aquimarina sp. AU58 TaxID=1874112 RepID=UPI000D6E0FE6|nr:hypothetical protein [Aquimarina sp. AU58]
MRSTKQIQSEINRAKGQIKAFQKDHFTDADRAVLIPKYKETLKKLEDELTEAIKQIEVNDPTQVGESKKAGTPSGISKKDSCSTT